MSNQNEQTYNVEFEVEEHPDTENETVSVKDSIIDKADPKERAVVAAAEKSQYTHIETVAIRKQEWKTRLILRFHRNSIDSISD